LAFQQNVDTLLGLFKTMWMQNAWTETSTSVLADVVATIDRFETLSTISAHCVYSIALLYDISYKGVAKHAHARRADELPLSAQGHAAARPRRHRSTVRSGMAVHDVFPLPKCRLDGRDIRDPIRRDFNAGPEMLMRVTRSLHPALTHEVCSWTATSRYRRR
jgi:hypothetical protein